MSASSLKVSTAGPLKRTGSARSLEEPPAVCTCRVRVSESLLYCNEMMRSTPAVSASTSTMPPLMSLGLPGNELMRASRPRPRRSFLYLPVDSTRDACANALRHCAVLDMQTADTKARRISCRAQLRNGLAIGESTLQFLL